jgi:hypothetical protein
MPKGRLYTWEDMARMGRQSPGTRSGRKLACCRRMYVVAISNRSSKDSSCAHKGLVTNWLHHTTPWFLAIVVASTTLEAKANPFHTQVIPRSLLKHVALGFSVLGDTASSHISQGLARSASEATSSHFFTCRHAHPSSQAT